MIPLASVKCHIMQLPLLLLLVSILNTSRHSFVSAQGCANTCPPINFGTPVPSLCEGDVATDSELVDIEKEYSVCHPTPAVRNTFRFADFLGQGRITVMSNVYIGCNAGRRESGAFAHVAQKYYNEYGNRTTFITSLKGGTTCLSWASMYQRDAVSLFPDSNVTPREMPLTVLDQEYEMRDDWFTTPFGHPSYVILDGDLRVRHKFVGPCCGYEGYYDCSADNAAELDETLSGYLDDLLAETDFYGNDNNTHLQNNNDNSSNIQNDLFNNAPIDEESSTPFCQVGFFSDWSPCSVSCGDKGIQFRWRTIRSTNTNNEENSMIPHDCPAPVETRNCTNATDVVVECPEPTAEQCIQEFGATWQIEEVASGFDSPRDVAFHPTPGLHLGNYSEGRQFHPGGWEEAWVLNGYNHSVSIVAALGSEYQTTISRRDRGYYHYMINATALAFNSVGESGRSPDRDSFNYWAVCNDDLNTYLGSKEANNFMGPTLYNSDPRNRNLVNRLGEECGESEPCYFLHADMLHESPACIGIAHDPETVTAYGNVFWAFDSTGNQQTGQLVRFDFQQPHGPGSMDHSVAAVRRYPDIELTRGPDGVHAGMVVHPTRRELYISVPGANKVLAVHADSGSYARTAREEYPIYSNRLPSFEYSIWECADQRDFATDIQTPTGLALSPDGERLFIAERDTGNILVYEIESGTKLFEIDTGFTTIGGMAVSPQTQTLHFVDEDTNTLNAVQAQAVCNNPVPSRVSETFREEATMAAEAVNSRSGSNNGNTFSLYRDYDCQVDPIIPDAIFFDQVHDDTGYASDNPDVQSMAGMDETAALLANRTDCNSTSELNFDQLLLGGYYCHQCLPQSNGSMCDAGGICTNIQWDGYYCDNEFWVVLDEESGRIVLQTSNKTTLAQEDEGTPMMLRNGVTYRINVDTGADNPVCVSPALSSMENTEFCATRGPLILTAGEDLSSFVLRAQNSTIHSFSVNNIPSTNSSSENSTIIEEETINATDSLPNATSPPSNSSASSLNSSQVNTVEPEGVDGVGGAGAEAQGGDNSEMETGILGEGSENNEESQATNTGMIVGIVVGMTCLLVVTGAVGLVLYKRRKNQAKELQLEEGATESLT